MLAIVVLIGSAAGVVHQIGVPIRRIRIHLTVTLLMGVSLLVGVVSVSSLMRRETRCIVKSTRIPGDFRVKPVFPPLS